jgi:pectate lyase
MTRWLMRAIVGLCLVSVGLLAAQAQQSSEADPATLVNATVEAKASQSLPFCAQAWPGLRVLDGVVTAADLIGEIGGYAGAAGTTGGLGGRLRVVTTLRDYDSAAHEPAIPGSLRQHLESAAREQTPAWIVFDPALGPGAHIEVKRTLRIPSNVTIDGSCADITLEASNNSKTILAYVASGVSNVIIARMAMRKTGYIPAANPDVESAIRVNGDFDRIAVLHNDLWECGDGCIDITVSPNAPVPTLARITVAFNYLRDHDTVMGFGTYCRPDGDDHRCGEAYLDKRRVTLPGLKLTLEGNLFARTGQRHPRVSGRVSAHIFNNIVAFRPLQHADGRFGAAYGIFVSNGARALVEANLFLPLVPLRPALAVWTVKSPGAMRMPADVEGFVRMDRNGIFGRAVATENVPDAVPDPDYAYHLLPLRDLPLKAALACISNRAGRAGQSQWNSGLCTSG